MLGSQIRKVQDYLMFRYQILIEYVGMNFRGWQVQKEVKHSRIIQEKFQILKRKNNIYMDPTDTGVHAIEQSAHSIVKTRKVF